MEACPSDDGSGEDGGHEVSGDVPGDEGETWARRAKSRLRQIQIGKSRPEYKRFLEAPVDRHSPSWPSTPDPHARIPKRQFDRELGRWRRQLHEYEQGLSAASEGARDAAERGGRGLDGERRDQPAHAVLEPPGLQQVDYQAGAGKPEQFPWAQAPWDAWPLNGAPPMIGFDLPAPHQPGWPMHQTACWASPMVPQYAPTPDSWGSALAPGMPSKPPVAAARDERPAVDVRGLPASFTEQDVLAMFAVHDVADKICEGTKPVEMISRAGESTIQAIVRMRNQKDSELAQKALNGKFFMTARIDVSIYCGNRI